MKDRFLPMMIVAMAFGLSSPAHAYLDPGTGSILLQAIIGGIVGGLVFIKVYWRKLRSYFGGRKADDGLVPKKSDVDDE